MKTKKERIQAVYAHLRAYHGIHTQTELAAALHVTQPVMSAAINGNESYLTKNLFMKVCAAFPGVFNLDFLLTGEGDLLTPEEDVKSSELANTASNQTVIDNLIEMLSRTIRESDDLRVELKQQLAEVRAAKEDLHTAVYEFRDATYRLTQALKQLNGTPADVRPLIAADDGDNNETKRK